MCAKSRSSSPHLRQSERVIQNYGRYALAESYRRLKSESEAQVRDWRWATGPMFEFDPYYAEKCRVPKGKWLKLQPTQPGYFWQYGLDFRSRPVVMRRTNEFPDQIQETFVVFAPDSIECIQYSDAQPKTLRSYECFDLVDAKPVRCEARRPDRASCSVYEYDQGRLVRETSRTEYFGSFPEHLEAELHYAYDPQGRLERIDGRRRNCQSPAEWIDYCFYRRPRPGETVKALSAEVERALLSSVPEKLRQARIAEPVYCLLLVYDLENEPLPPALALGTESLRQQVRAAHGTEAKYYLWNPADFVHFNRPDLELTDAALGEACSRLNDLLTGRNNLDPARRVLNSVAAQLQQRDWTGILNTTDDFVVVAVDLESQDDLHKNIKQSVPAERIRQLRRQGLLV